MSMCMPVGPRVSSMTTFAFGGLGDGGHGQFYKGSGMVGQMYGGRQGGGCGGRSMMGGHAEIGGCMQSYGGRYMDVGYGRGFGGSGGYMGNGRGMGGGGGSGISGGNGRGHGGSWGGWGGADPINDFGPVVSPQSMYGGYGCVRDGFGGFKGNDGYGGVINYGPRGCVCCGGEYENLYGGYPHCGGFRGGCGSGCRGHTDRNCMYPGGYAGYGDWGGNLAYRGHGLYGDYLGNGACDTRIIGIGNDITPMVRPANPVYTGVGH